MPAEKDIMPFSSIESFTAVPNDVIDYLMRECSGGEWKIVTSVIRKTTGWRKASDKISISQLMELTGMSNHAVIDGTNQALQHGYITRVKDGQSYSYSLNKYFKMPAAKPADQIPVREDSPCTYEESSQVENQDLCKKFTGTYEESSQEPMKKVHTQKKEIKKKIIPADQKIFILKCLEIGSVERFDNAWQYNNLLKWREEYGEERVIAALTYYILRGDRLGIAIAKMNRSIATWRMDDAPAFANARPGQSRRGKLEDLVFANATEEAHAQEIAY